MAELIEWGAVEDERRSVEIEAVTSAEDLQRVRVRHSRTSRRRSASTPRKRHDG